MAIKFRKNAVKFLEKADIEDSNKIQEKLNQLLIFIKDIQQCILSKYHVLLDDFMQKNNIHEST